MPCNSRPPDVTSRPVQPSERFTLPASSYNFDQLADIYNQCRVDYIVPMPMNGKRMTEYVKYYDIDLDGSVVSLNESQLETGISMLGIRGDRSWITRLGVIPDRRGHKIGQYLMEALIEESAARNLSRVQLEVIVGNEPAHHLFCKLGFEDYRELMVVRRPPGKPTEDLNIAAANVSEIDEGQILYYLEQRDYIATWHDETASFLNASNLHGLSVELANGETGWIIFQRTPFQLTRFAVGPFNTPDAMRTLLYHVHSEYAMQDTKIENIPSQSTLWPVFQSMGYIEVFRRIEMFLDL